MLEVVKICAERDKKVSHIVHSSNMNHLTLKRQYIPALIKHGLIEQIKLDEPFHRTKYMFRTTSKGIELLRLFDIKFTRTY